MLLYMYVTSKCNVICPPLSCKMHDIQEFPFVVVITSTCTTIIITATTMMFIWILFRKTATIE
jgi:hypothetical protein